MASASTRDLQSILNRAVQIAQIPMTRLQNRDSTVLQQKSSLVSLQSDVAALASSMQSLGKLANQALSATSSNPDVVTVASTGATSPATYTINSFTSPAAAASETSLSSYADFVLCSGFLQPEHGSGGQVQNLQLHARHE
ncbi:MAG TPA: flagellar cap protein FliD N-terminal domain-containing protein [Bryobacteraceae bacterium]|nr:flagellar cap protein FliD N-terminal domain-containing protein [Bryobacteraceae bacterium]